MRPLEKPVLEKAEGGFETRGRNTVDGGVSGAFLLLTCYERRAILCFQETRAKIKGEGGISEEKREEIARRKGNTGQTEIL